jgi:hypothetical protein
MPTSLTSSQQELAKEVLLRHGASTPLLAALDRNELSADQAKALGDAATEDLAATGFNAEYTLTELGERLEDLIDALNVAD